MEIISLKKLYLESKNRILNDCPRLRDIRRIMVDNLVWHGIRLQPFSSIELITNTDAEEAS